ncbi:MAG TPA: acetate--CoA ligase [Candidatus Nitrosotenuis sp.]
MTGFVFVPTKEQIENSNIFKFMQKHNIKSFKELHKKSVADLDWYWNAVNEDIGIVWDKKYTIVSDFSKGKPWPKWFVDGKTNIINSGVDKFATKYPNQIAYCFVSEDDTEKIITYSQLETDVNKLANALKALNVKKGDVVAVYMPMIFEAIVAILACAKIGAVQTVIFSGYSTEALRIRLQDCGAKILFVSDGFTRKGKPVSQTKTVLDATRDTGVEKIIVAPYKGVDRYYFSESVIDYSKLVANQSPECQAEIMDSEDPLFILYTSGTTGKPKGVVHTHGSYSVYAGQQASYLIDLHSDDVLLWPADIGWITGLAWNVYGLLEVGATAIIYDGAIDWPNPSRLWQMVQKYKVTIFGTSPTAVRMFRKYKIEPQKQFNLSSIRIIPTTGEPIDEDSWWWLYEKVGNKKIPIMNLAGGTEIGGAMLSVFPGMKLKPTTVGMPCPGFDLDVIDEKQKSLKNKKGFLVVRSPWPTMTRGLLNDDDRYTQTYWSQYKDVWFHGDYVLVDNDGLWYMHGRVDDVINISGHRLSTVEIEQVAVVHQKISEAAAISIPDDMTGEAIALFVVLKNKNDSDSIQKEITDHISEKIGKLAKPKLVCVISDMPKTRTGKIMRRLLKTKLLGEPLGDLSALENPYVLDEIVPI